MLQHMAKKQYNQEKKLKSHSILSYNIVLCEKMHPTNIHTGETLS